MFLLVLLAFGVIALAEVPSLVKKKMWRELAAFSIYLLLGLALSLPQALGLKVPNPTRAIEALFRPVSELLR